MFIRTRALAIGAPAIAVCVAAASLMLGSTARADGDLRLDTRQPMAPRAIARFNEARVAALLTQAPPSERGRCVATIDVPGQGPSCRIAGSSLWGVKLANGRTASTHGPDVIADAGPMIDNDAALGLSNAGDLVGYPVDSAFVACTTDLTVPHYVAVYARHTGTNAADATLVRQRIRIGLRQASAFVRSQSIESGAIDNANTARLRFACGATGAIDVQQVLITPSNDDPALDSPTDPYDISFSELTGLLNGSTAKGGFSNTSRIVAFYDGNSASGASGQGGLYGDSSPAGSNNNNRSNLIAVHYRVDPTPTPAVWWDVFLHEMFHNFGATQDAAPDANGEGHCTTDADIMCYDEIATLGNGRGIAVNTFLPTSLTAGCSTTKLDCHYDTYFNAGPTCTGWISDHWNAGRPTNQWIDFGARTADVYAPSDITNLRASSPGPFSYTFLWDAATDDSGCAPTYRVNWRTGGSAWRSTTTGTTSATVGSLDYTGNIVRIDSVDQLGNAHVGIPVPLLDFDPPAPTSTTGGTATVAPPKPPKVATVVPTVKPLPGCVLVAWRPRADGAAAAAYRIQVTDGTGKVQRIAVERGSTGQFVPVRAGTLAHVTVQAFVSSGTGVADVASIRVAGPVGRPTCSWKTNDAAPPTKPGAANLIRRARTSLTAAFAPSTDANGVCGYRLLQKVGVTWRLVGAVPAAAKTATFRALKANTRARVAIQAFDASGNLSATVKVRTRTT
ncbi:MAG: hypothetical protein H7287_00080 [Thermoleophilia bacterium]|nr:hypothetical protein [Thermoleophilia bacterium]